MPFNHLGSYGSSSLKDSAPLVLFFLLPFDHKLSNIAIALILFLSLITLFKTHKPSGSTFVWVPVPWILPGLFLYFLISQLVSGGDWQPFEKRLLLVFVPLTFALTPAFFKRELRAKIFASYVLGNVVVILICFARAFIRSLSFQDGSIVFNAKVIEDSRFDFLTSSVMGGNHFFEEQFSVFHHPMYFGLYIVFAQYLIFEIGKSRNLGISRGWLIGCYIFFTFALFFLSSKAVIISSFLLTFYLFFKVRVPNRVRTASLAAIIGLTIFFVSYNPKLQILATDFNFTQLFDPNPLAQSSHELRILSWNASLAIIKKNLLFGVGEGNKEAALLHEYNVKGYIVPSDQLHNSHNQYLDFLIGGGITGFALLIIGLGWLFARGVKKGNHALLIFLSIFCFVAAFENLLSRHTGLLIFTVFISFLASEPRRQSVANHS